MEQSPQKRFLKLRRYEDSLRQSMQSFDKVCKSNPFHILIQNPISYQFRHWQLKKKKSFVLSLHNKPSYSHLTTISTHSRKISQLSAQDLTRETKGKVRVKKTKTSERSVSPIFVKEVDMSTNDAALIVRSRNMGRAVRTRTVTPCRGLKDCSSEARRSQEIRSNKITLVENKLQKEQKIDNEIAPWQGE
jgi:hypothetical protein